MHLSRYLLLLAASLPGVAAGASGPMFAVPGPAEPQAVAAAKSALAKEMYGADGAWSQASLPVGSTALLMRVQSGAFCGDVGCPTAVLLQAPGGWMVVWTGMSVAKGGVLPTAHHGLHDIALAAGRGQRTLRFDGHAYVEVP